MTEIKLYEKMVSGFGVFSTNNEKRCIFIAENKIALKREKIVKVQFVENIENAYRKVPVSHVDVIEFWCFNTFSGKLR